MNRVNDLSIDWAGGLIKTGGNGGLFLNVEPAAGPALVLSLPRFRLRECAEAPVFSFAGQEGERVLKNGGLERRLLYRSREGLRLEADLQTFPGSPALRFRFRLSSAGGTFHFAKPGGRDDVLYTEFSPGPVKITELQFSQYIPHIHSYTPRLNPLRNQDLRFGLAVPGPVLMFENEHTNLLIGYEHGATYPDSYLEYTLRPDEDKKDAVKVSLRARKGNTFDGQPLDGEHDFTSVWFHLLAVCGGQEALDREYRVFFHHHISQNTESRKPYIFYNTWNYQERDGTLRGKPYLANMRLERVLEEIEKAREIGIDVFVIDTGWFSRTGDWLVNLERFPDGMKQVKEKLSSYGMKLGLWFNPTVAALNSRIVTEHPEYRMTVDGLSKSHPVWETEESCGMCLCSGYWEAFADRLIALHNELDVCYFKWDGIGQSGCDSPLHDHGGTENSPEERAACYGYLMGLRMISIAERLTESCPGAIVDFDITEGGRFVGLGFLSAGKYFLVNNGPYAKDFDLPEEYRFALEQPIRLEPYTNIFFYPGAARPRFCRTGLRYDRFMPSSLFLTHYLPDGDPGARENSLASLVLGGNGIWGSLSELTAEETAFWRDHLSLYKQVRDAATAAAAHVTGTVGSSPEIYEKVDPDSGSGLIVFFTSSPGTYSYVAGPFLNDRIPKVLCADGYEILDGGYLRITVKLARDGARTVFLTRAATGSITEAVFCPTLP
ncbi:MAG: alpha-galactosidase [Treponema sp.]|jgi:alpha-galactosidase|nr:alpha-galactosidase [Treponema sp.]